VEREVGEKLRLAIGVGNAQNKRLHLKWESPATCALLHLVRENKCLEEKSNSPAKDELPTVVLLPNTKPY
jgi:hypothetical protein